MNLIETFLATAERRAEQIAIVAPDGGTTHFGDLAARTSGLAAAWRRQGIEPGDRVLLAMPLGPDLYAGIAALWQLGAVAVFPEPAMGLRGLRHAVAATRPKAFLSAGAYRLLRWVVPEVWRMPLHLDTTPAIPPFTAIHPASRDHPALISFTSGSTGQPKGIVRSHGFLAAQNACVARMLIPGREVEVDLVAFPVFVIVNLGLGITSVLPNWRLTRQDTADPAAVARLVADRGVTRLLVPPSICEIIAQGPELARVAAVFTGGGPVFPDVVQRLAGRLPSADVVSVYGSTEAEPIAHHGMRAITEADWQAMRGGGGLLAGHPIAEIRLRLVEDEILVTGEHVNKSYLDGRGDAANKVPLDGEIWHRTGDAGRLDDSGRLWLLGRKEAKVGKLFPFQVEVAARFWPGVRRAALVPRGEGAVLAIEGDPACQAQCNRLAGELGDIEVRYLKAIPLDRRHRSKVDYVSLRAIMK